MARRHTMVPVPTNEVIDVEPLELRQAPLVAALRQIESSFPVHEVIHSLLAQAFLETSLRDTPALQGVGEIARAHLDATAAAAGYIRRILAGDSSPAVTTGLQQQIRAMERTHTESRSAIQQLMRTDAARATEVTRTIAEVAGIADQAHRSVISAVAPLLSGQAPFTVSPQV